jgi:hypothetical protein
VRSTICGASRFAHKKTAALKKVLLFFCGLRRAIRGSLRSYLRPLSRAWYGAQARRRYYPSRLDAKIEPQTLFL